ncbi:MAG: hypothetical protein K2M87_07480 [Muribaculaceae bacterium]|nr:hypothetical protein [Muribaculaceae bacterium]
MIPTERENEIRRLLEKWYSATLSADEETRLRQLLQMEGELPADLAADRNLLSALDEAIQEETEIPEEYAKRINDALEREIGVTRMRTKWKRRRIWGVAAAMLALVVVFSYRVSQPQAPQDKLAKTDDKLKIEVRMPEKSQKLNNVTADGENNRESEKKASTKRHITKTKLPQNEPHDSVEEPYINEHYHVVTDQREAEALLASIFGRLESQIDIESDRVTEINSEYEMEMDKLTNPVEVSTIQTLYHENS